MTAFINGSCAVSPQMTFSGEFPGHEPVNYTGVSHLQCIDPPVNEFIDPMISRRMSRIIRFGVCSALRSLQNAGIQKPDGIIVGTGLGCIEDTEKFLRNLHANEEKLLNPTPFIQSTHNTVASTIAIILKCNGYNSTYVHRGISFESSLTDAVLLLKDSSFKTVLVGGIDELTPDSFNITRRLGLWKRDPVDSLSLLNYKNKGTLPGEGMNFFVLSGERNDKSIAEIRMPDIFYKPATSAEIENRIISYVGNNIGDLGNIDLIIMGLNGDIYNDEVYKKLINKVFRKIPCAYYKHLCGEYDTSSSFAFFLATEIVKKQTVPEIMMIEGPRASQFRNVLIYNHVRNVNHTLIQVSKC